MHFGLAHAEIRFGIRSFFGQNGRLDLGKKKEHKLKL